MDEKFWNAQRTIWALADELSPCISPDPSSASMGLSVEKELGISLHLLKDTGSITVTASAFGVSVPTVSKTIRSVCNAINTYLGPRYLKLPTVNELYQTVNLSEERFGFPQVLGAVDGRDIAINKPTEDTQSYFSYKMKYILYVQAVCDAKGTFLDVGIRWPWVGAHMLPRFLPTQISIMLCKRAEFRSYTKLCSLVERRCLLLADPAYPLLPYCMKEYSTCCNNAQVIFNTMLRSACNQI